MTTHHVLVVLLLAACTSNACARMDAPPASSNPTTPPPATSSQAQTPAPSADEPVALVTETDTPGFVTMNVRGLNTIMEAALQQTPASELRIALLDEGQVRYYSNDAATAGALPAAFATWRASFADVPVKLMSVPGQPLLQARTQGE